MLLLASMAFGNIGGALQIARLLTILFIPLLFKRINSCRKGLKVYWQFFIFFIAYCSFSLIWTPDKTEGAIQLIYFIIHFLFFFEILFFSRLASNPTDTISKGWMISVILTLIVAMWEITTGNHLSFIAHNTDGVRNINGNAIQQKFAAVTFYNFNTYVTFLCLALPFIYYKIVDIHKISFAKILSILVILASYFCILCNASRGGLLSICVMFIVYLMRLPNKWLKLLILLVICAIGVWFFIQFADVYLMAISVRSSEGFLEDSSRMSIWAVALRTFETTMGLGTGIGGTISSMSMFTSGITVPHNLFLEVLLEFGVIVFAFFMFFILKLYYYSFKLKDGITKTVLYIALIPLPIYSIIDSRYLLNYWVFAFFASLIVFLNSHRFYRYTINNKTMNDTSQMSQISK